MTNEQITQTNCIICGDCRDQLARIPDGSVDLIYLDPPFFSGKNYEIIWKDGAEIRSFTDTEFYTLVCKCGEIFPDGNKFCATCGAPRDEAVEHKSKDIQAYLQWLRPRLERCQDALKDTGSIYVHLDHHAVFHVKVMMDEIFGVKNFQNEIVWCYSGGGVPKTAFARKHDTILMYSKTSGKDRVFNIQYMPYSDASKKLVNANGGVSIDGKKRDLDRGAHMNDWWVDLNALQTWSPEKLGYPTQKPEALLERIIKASSNPGDTVLDPFCGCGTCVAVAEKLGRKWIGIDVSPTSTKLMVKRLQTTGAKITEADIVDLPRTCKELRHMDPFEFQNLVIAKLDGKQNPKKTNDLGVDGWTYKTDEFGMRHKQIGLDAAVQVKRSQNISFPEIQKFIGAMQTDTETDGKRGVFVAFSFVKTAKAKLNKLMVESGITVDLMTVEELFECED